MVERQSYYVGVKGLIRNKAEILVLRDTSTGKWELPGGRIDKGGDIKSSFAREIEEEIKGARLKKLGKIIHAAQGDFLVENNYTLLLLFYLAIVDLPKTIILSKEHSGSAWVSAYSLLKYNIYSTDRAAIELALSVI